MYNLLKRNRIKFLKLTIGFTVVILVTILSVYNNGKIGMPSKETMWNFNLKDMVINKNRSHVTVIRKECTQSKENIVKQFRSLTRQYIGDFTNNSNSIDTCALPRDIQDDERFAVMMKRVKSLREICQINPPVELMASLDPRRFYQDNNNSVIACNSPKAASSTVYHYMKVLQLTTDPKSSKDSTLLRENYLPPVDVEHLTLTDRETDLAFVVVRHPFTRVLSCYINKVEATIHYETRYNHLYKRMLEFSTMSPTEVSTTMDELLPENGGESFKCDGNIKTREESVRYRHLMRPTFRGFVLTITESILRCRKNVDCLLKLEQHFKQQSVKCSTCKMEYDLVVKTETLREDLLFFEKLWKLPPIYELHLDKLARDAHELRLDVTAKRGNDLQVNVSQMRKSYAKYMSELSTTELHWLYTAYFPDFQAFRYDPCEDLQIQ